MSALYLTDLAQKTPRGLEGRVYADKSAGGSATGTLSTDAPALWQNEQRRPDHRSRSGGDRPTGLRTLCNGRERTGDRRASQCRALAWPARRHLRFSTISGNWKRGAGLLNAELNIG